MENLVPFFFKCILKVFHYRSKHLIMCDLSNGFKLCSCDGDQLKPEEIGWTLRRKDENKEIQNIRGKPFVPKFDLDEQQLKTTVAQALNERNCFDFEYQPQEDDFLSIRTKRENIWFAFRYKKGRWQEDNSTKFNSWRQQLEQYKVGIVEN